jgi:hypothetical protein
MWGMEDRRNVARTRDAAYRRIRRATGVAVGASVALAGTVAAYVAGAATHKTAETPVAAPRTVTRTTTTTKKVVVPVPATPAAPSLAASTQQQEQQQQQQQQQQTPVQQTPVQPQTTTVQAPTPSYSPPVAVSGGS